MGHGGRVHGNNLECPFHAWRYDDTGAVTEIPYAQTIPPQAKKANCVRSWEVLERNGLIWIWHHPEGKAPLWESDIFPEVGAADWTPLKKFEWRVFNSARNMMDNAGDTAHFLYVHRTANFPEAEIEMVGNRFKSIARAKLGTPKGLVDGAIISDSTSPSQGRTRFQGISDTLMVNATTPVEKDELHVRFAFTQPRSEAEGPMGGLARALIRDICKQLDQDKIIWDRLRHEPNPLMCDGDGPIPLLRQHYDQFLTDEAFERMKGKRRAVQTRAKM
jgi:phenylpropionate dioxygenase-like ring-hydroxylating dioxygenase large terminal subunit